MSKQFGSDSDHAKKIGGSFPEANSKGGRPSIGAFVNVNANGPGLSVLRTDSTSAGAFTNVRANGPGLSVLRMDGSKSARDLGVQANVFQAANMGNSRTHLSRPFQGPSNFDAKSVPNNQHSTRYEQHLAKCRSVDVILQLLDKRQGP